MNIFIDCNISLKKILKELIAFLFICIAVSISYGALLVVPSASPPNDLIRAHLYGDAVVKNNIKLHSQIGLWDEYSAFGQPLIGGVSSQFYPPTAIYLLFDDLIKGLRINMLFHLVLGSYFFYLLMRVMKSHWFLSVTGGILFVCNYYVESKVNTGSLSDINNLPWMVSVFLSVYLLMNTRKKIYIFLAGGALSMHILSMSLFSLYFSNIALGILVGFHIAYLLIVKKAHFSKSIIDIIFPIILVYILGVGISAVKLIPVLEFSLHSTRSSLPLYGYGNPLHKSWELETITSSISNVLQFVARDSILNKYALINFLFPLAIILAFFSRKKEAFIFFTIVIVSIWASMGRNAFIDLYKVIYFIIPGISSIEHPQRFWILINFAFPALFVIGFSFLSQVLSKRMNALSSVLTYVGCMVVIYAAVNYVSGQMNYFYIPDSQNAYSEENMDVIGILNTQKSEKNEFHVASSYDLGNHEIYAYTAFSHNFLLFNPQVYNFTTKYSYFPQDANISNDLFKNEYFTFEDKKYFTKSQVKLFKTYNTKYLIVDEESDLQEYEGHGTAKKIPSGKLYSFDNVLPYVHSSQYNLLLIADNQLKDFDSFLTRYFMLFDEFSPEKFSIVASSSMDTSDVVEYMKNFDGVLLQKNVKFRPDFKKALDEYRVGKNTIFEFELQKRGHKDYRGIAFSILSAKPELFISESKQKTYRKFLKSFDARNIHTKSQLKISTPEYKKISTETKKNFEIITVADSYYPGWLGFEKGKKQPVVMVNGLPKGIIIANKGKHEIELIFAPKSFHLGLAVTITTLTVLAFLGLRRLKESLVIIGHKNT